MLIGVNADEWIHMCIICLNTCICSLS